jgi:hypothetical protein
MNERSSACAVARIVASSPFCNDFVDVRRKIAEFAARTKNCGHYFHDGT